MHGALLTGREVFTRRRTFCGGRQTLGQVGNTGNSTMPHLHFHVTDGPSPLGSNGLPYTFDRFDHLAKIDYGTGDVTFTPPPTARRRLLPMTGDVIAFP